MKQPVRVGLYFSRSGQELFVQLPIPIAETVEARRYEHKSYRVETTSAAALVGPTFLDDNATYTR
jgi:hypothetical protein